MTARVFISTWLQSWYVRLPKRGFIFHFDGDDGYTVISRRILSVRALTHYRDGLVVN
jgi:hypothetical protein